MDFQDSQSKTEQVVSALRASILKGEIPAGGKLKSVRALAAQFDVSQWIVSSALEALDKEGLLRREQGRGVFVERSSKREELEVYLLLWGLKGELNSYAVALSKLASPDSMPEDFSFMTRTVFSGERKSLDDELARIDKLGGVKCVVAAISEFSKKELAKFSSLHCPTLFIGDSVLGRLDDLKLDRIVLEPQGGAEAVEMLSARGFKSLSLVVGSRRIYYYEKFASTTERACEKAGVELRQLELPFEFQKTPSESIRLRYRELIASTPELFRAPLILYGYDERTLVDELEASGLAPERLPAVFPQIKASFLSGFYGRIYKLIREIAAEPGRIFNVSHVGPVLLSDLRNDVAFLSENGELRPFKES